MKVRLKLKKTWITVFAIVLLAISMSVPVLAAPTIDMSKLGSIKIDVTGVYGSLSGIEFSVFKVANLSGSGVYSLTSDFSGSGVVLKNLTTASAASAASKTLASYVTTNSIAGTKGSTNSSGIVTFDKLSLGYYLVVQTVTSTTSSVSSPFLIAVPMTSSSGSDWVYDYDIVAYPKSEPTPPPPSNEYGAVILEKVNSEGTLLSGAIFRLEKKAYYSSTSSIPSGAETGFDSGGAYYWGTYSSDLVTNNYGQIGVNNLPFGQYRFIETTAPSGYELDSSPNEFAITVSGAIELLDGKYRRLAGSVENIVVLNSVTPSPPIEPPDSPSPSPSPTPTPTPSQPGFNLPQTGGSVANAVCTYGGVVLVICGVAVFIASGKKKDKK